MNSASNDFKELLKFLLIYQSKKTRKLVSGFEHLKNNTVGLLMHRRGKFQKHFFHTSMIGLSSVGLLASGIIGGDSMVSKSFPGVAAADPRQIQTFDPNEEEGGLKSLIDFKTSISDKPRSEILDYEVKSGETISQIAEKFGIDTDTIKWANNLDSIHTVKPGQTIKILPVSGVAHTVVKGDTLESVAKKYSVDSQSIIQFPFNDIPDDFTLKVGQLIIIPDGTPPEAKVPPKPKYQPLSPKGPAGPVGPSFLAPGGGNFVWPTSFSYISTQFAWWHPGIDLPNPSAPRVVASDGGTVISAGWPDNYGYGNRVMIDHGNGYRSLYAHLSNVYVSIGQKVSRGQLVGQMGSTGRSTGIHLHYEIHYKGVALNPLKILR